MLYEILNRKPPVKETDLESQAQENNEHSHTETANNAPLSSYGKIVGVGLFLTYLGCYYTKLLMASEGICTDKLLNFADGDMHHSHLIRCQNANDNADVCEHNRISYNILSSIPDQVLRTHFPRLG